MNITDGYITDDLDISLADHAAKQAAAQVQVLKLKPGDILVVKLGIADMGEGLPPWLPHPAELESIRDDLECLVPDGVKIIIHHFGVDFEVIRDIENAAEVWVEENDDIIKANSDIGAPGYNEGGMPSDE